MIDVQNNQHDFIKKMISLEIVCSIDMDFSFYKMYELKNTNHVFAVKSSIVLNINSNLTNSELLKITTEIKKCIDF